MSKHKELKITRIVCKLRKKFKKFYTLTVVRTVERPPDVQSVAVQHQDLHPFRNLLFLGHEIRQVKQG